MISGRGGGLIGNTIFQSVLMWEHDNNVLAWYERVPSAANVADSPSRGDVSGLDRNSEINVDVDDVLRSLMCPSDVRGEKAE